jgi:hypothetical protein
MLKTENEKVDYRILLPFHVQIRPPIIPHQPTPDKNECSTFEKKLKCATDRVAYFQKILNVLHLL